MAGTVKFILEIQKGSGNLVKVSNLDGSDPNTPEGPDQRKWRMKDIIIDAVDTVSSSRAGCSSGQCGVTINNQLYCFNC